MVDKLRLEVLLAAVDKVSGPLKSVAQGSKATAKALGETELALKNLQAQQRALAKFERERESLDGARQQLDMAKAVGANRTVVRQLTADYEKQLGVVKKLQTDMAGRGWGNATVDQRQLADSIARTNSALDAQRQKLAKQRDVEERLHNLREKHSKDMVKLAAWGGAAAGATMAGSKLRSPLTAAVNAFMPAEDAETQLGASLMRADGKIPESMQKMVDLATKLGDKLPGTTKDFIELTQALSQEGLSDQSILGGTAEASAYLAVQLKKVPKEAAAMAAKMQDATRATEAEMMGVLDMVQRGHYAGADADYMLAGFTKMSPVLDITKRKGLDAMNALSPMMVMMNQAGMTDGGSAGNAIRKVFQSSMSEKKLDKANGAIKAAKGGFTLDFSDGKGEFGGIEQMFAQLQKLSKLNTMQRGNVIGALFGDDAETLQVVNTMMTKGIDGYNESLKKLTDQASLQMRVNEQLKTLTNVADAASGSFTNMMKEFGAAIAPELKAVLTWLGGLANRVGTFARENPKFTKAVMLSVAALSALLTVAGTVGIALVAMLGPMHLARFLLARTVLNMAAVRAAASGASPVLGMMGRAWAFVSGGVGRLLPMLLRFAGPIGWLILAGTLIYKYWEPLSAFFSGFGAGLMDGLAPAIASFRGVIAPLMPMLGVLGGYLQRAWKWFMDLFTPVSMTTAEMGKLSNIGQLFGAIFGGILTSLVTLPMRFFELGANIVQGIANGITSRIQAVRDSISMAAGDAVDWFKEKLGIRSPSRVFMELGGYVREGAAQGISGGAGMVRNAALGMAAGSMVAMSPVMAGQGMGPGGVGGAGGVGGGAAISIVINAAPGMDPQAVAKAVAAELDRRERDKASRKLSTLGDID